MDTISERIDTIINELGLNKNSFSKAIGMGNNVTIGRIINEQRDPSFDVLAKIIQTFGHIINAKWLLTGEGEMRINKQQNLVQEPEGSYHPKDKENIDKIITNLEFLSDSLKVELEKLKSKMT